MLLTSRTYDAFWLTAIALFGLLGMQAVYWIRIHQINKFWLQNASVPAGGLGAGFFGTHSEGGSGQERTDWTQYRDHWEYAHIARAALAFVSFFSLVLALAIAD